MNVKIDTKEKFQVLTPAESTLSENMTDELRQLLLSYLKKEIKNVVLNLKYITTMDEAVAECILSCQQQFYEEQSSFVICELSSELETFLDHNEFLDLMNFTPTESEAWDIVQMEEIERELFEDE
ncbi:MAG: STAS domain-containing protein [Lacibacter sp.]